jgi:tetratricopeptide (TPR) repeat protein
VARFLVAAGMAEDPEEGYGFAQAAKRLAARVGVVREACGIVAYQTGRWADALSEFRAARRMTGRDDYVPIMADCERALGRPDRALALVHEVNADDLSRPTQIELRIVESGIRRDQGLADAAVLLLQVPELTSGRVRPWSARLFYAYGDALLAADRAEEARTAFARAVEIDPDGETDAAERLDELDGIVLDDLEDDEFQDDDLEDDLEDGEPEVEDGEVEDDELEAELKDGELDDDSQDDDPEDDDLEDQLEDEAEVAKPGDESEDEAQDDAPEVAEPKDELEGEPETGDLKAESEKAESEDEPQDKQDKQVSELEKS